jgi:hypothetical protein
MFTLNLRFKLLFLMEKCNNIEVQYRLHSAPTLDSTTDLIEHQKPDCIMVQEAQLTAS